MFPSSSTTLRQAAELVRLPFLDVEVPSLVAPTNAAAAKAKTKAKAKPTTKPKKRTALDRKVTEIESKHRELGELLGSVTRNIGDAKHFQVAKRRLVELESRIKIRVESAYKHQDEYPDTRKGLNDFVNDTLEVLRAPEYEEALNALEGIMDDSRETLASFIDVDKNKERIRRVRKYVAEARQRIQGAVAAADVAKWKETEVRVELKEVERALGTMKVDMRQVDFVTLVREQIHQFIQCEEDGRAALSLALIDPEVDRIVHKYSDALQRQVDNLQTRLKRTTNQERLRALEYVQKVIKAPRSGDIGTDQVLLNNSEKILDALNTVQNIWDDINGSWREFLNRYTEVAETDAEVQQASKKKQNKRRADSTARGAQLIEDPASAQAAAPDVPIGEGIAGIEIKPKRTTWRPSNKNAKGSRKGSASPAGAEAAALQQEEEEAQPDRKKKGKGGRKKGEAAPPPAPVSQDELDALIRGIQQTKLQEGHVAQCRVKATLANRRARAPVEEVAPPLARARINTAGHECEEVLGAGRTDGVRHVSEAYLVHLKKQGEDAETVDRRDRRFEKHTYGSDVGRRESGRRRERRARPARTAEDNAPYAAKLEPSKKHGNEKRLVPKVEMAKAIRNRVVKGTLSNETSARLKAIEHRGMFAYGIVESFGDAGGALTPPTLVKESSGRIKFVLARTFKDAARLAFLATMRSETVRRSLMKAFNPTYGSDPKPDTQNAVFTHSYSEEEQGGLKLDLVFGGPNVVVEESHRGGGHTLLATQVRLSSAPDTVYNTCGALLLSSAAACVANAAACAAAAKGAQLVERASPMQIPSAAKGAQPQLALSPKFVSALQNHAYYGRNLTVYMGKYMVDMLVQLMQEYGYNNNGRTGAGAALPPTWLGDVITETLFDEQQKAQGGGIIHFYPTKEEWKRFWTDAAAAVGAAPNKEADYVRYAAMKHVRERIVHRVLNHVLPAVLGRIWSFWKLILDGGGAPAAARTPILKALKDASKSSLYDTHALNLSVSKQTAETAFSNRCTKVRNLVLISGGGGGLIEFNKYSDESNSSMPHEAACAGVLWLYWCTLYTVRALYTSTLDSTGLSDLFYLNRVVQLHLVRLRWTTVLAESPEAQTTDRAAIYAYAAAATASASDAENNNAASGDAPQQKGRKGLSNRACAADGSEVPLAVEVGAGAGADSNKELQSVYLVANMRVSEPKLVHIVRGIMHESVSAYAPKYTKAMLRKWRGHVDASQKPSRVLKKSLEQLKVLLGDRYDPIMVAKTAWPEEKDQRALCLVDARYKLHEKQVYMQADCKYDLEAAVVPPTVEADGELVKDAKEGRRQVFHMPAKPKVVKTKTTKAKVPKPKRNAATNNNERMMNVGLGFEQYFDDAAAAARSPGLESIMRQEEQGQSQEQEALTPTLLRLAGIPSARSGGTPAATSASVIQLPAGVNYDDFWGMEAAGSASSARGEGTPAAYQEGEDEFVLDPDLGDLDFLRQDVPMLPSSAEFRSRNGGIGNKKRNNGKSRR